MALLELSGLLATCTGGGCGDASKGTHKASVLLTNYSQCKRLPSLSSRRAVVSDQLISPGLGNFQDMDLQW